MNPDEPYKRMGAHVFEVEYVDLSEHGYPGLSFSGWIDVEVDNSDAPTWFIGGAHATDPTDPKGGVERYAPNDNALGTAIAMAVNDDARLCELIEDACYYHGED